MPQKIIPNLWFDTEAEEAAEFYTSVFKDSRIVNVTHYTEAGPREAGMVMTVEFELEGERFIGINGGPEFKPSRARPGLCRDRRTALPSRSARPARRGRSGPSRRCWR
jgi:predicted 3-demethylubiquinone-9 3-methyltransferase (glyoxalase superfamily)